ncbi:MAG: hypothetical protein JWM57_1818 [Phycisphaerales bacterium]|nr:hypothetical protein [Phycisphaerales bacterium]
MTYALGLLLSACLTHGPIHGAAKGDTTASAPLTTPFSQIVDLRPLEVRVRKLHMVRPDLLQFPIPYDVIC